MNIVTIVGARPQFIKAAMVSHAIARHNAENPQQKICEMILHTGQHFDENMSQIFFDELQIPAPTWHLDCANLSVDEMKNCIISVLETVKIDCILVFGDTNSTLAGALAAEQMNLPLVHVEAGLRSYNNVMREEYNRIETDRRSDLLFCPTEAAVENLQKEKICKNVFNSGDVMFDAAIFYGKIAAEKSDILPKLQLTEKSFSLATIHRAETTDDKEKMRNILVAFSQIATAERPIVWPIHPRTQKVIETDHSLQEILQSNCEIRIVEPVSYVEMVALERAAWRIFTDSGGVQKEAFFHKTPCVTLRNETEWVETVAADWNVLVGTETDKILSAVSHEFACRNIDKYGDGKSAEKIVNQIAKSYYN